MSSSLKPVNRMSLSQKKKINAKQVMLIEMLKKNSEEIEAELDNLSEAKDIVIKKKNSEKDAYYEENSTLENIKRYTYERINAKAPSQENDIMLFLIGKIDNDGFLRDDIVTLKNEILLYLGIKKTTDEIRCIVDKLKGFFPYGIGLANEQDFKLWQIEKLKEKVILSELVNKFYTKLKKYDYLQLLKKYSKEELKNAFNIYFGLKSSPKDYFSSAEKEIKLNIDFFVHQIHEEEFDIKVNEIKIPQIFVCKNNIPLESYNKKYVDYLKNKELYVKNFCDNIKKRNEYLNKLIRCVVTIQKDFFFTGSLENLKPMTYKIIQESTGMSISTISRIVSTKRVQTDFGVFFLKDLFSKHIKSNNNISVTSVLFKISNLIEKNKVLNDIEITKKLADININLERRTVSNYRKKLGIANSFVREVIFLFEQ